MDVVRTFSKVTFSTIFIRNISESFSYIMDVLKTSSERFVVHIEAMIHPTIVDSPLQMSLSIKTNTAD